MLKANRLLGIPLFASVLLLVACGDTPSGLGNLAKEKLTQQKSSFESTQTQAQFKRFINDSSLSPELKRSAFNAYNEALQLSASVKPEYAKSAVDSSEMALACMLSMLKNQDEVDRFIDNATGSIADNGSRARLFGQLVEAKRLVATAAIKKENCK